MATDRIDAIVVGGGLAGVTAARDLAHSGARTILVEARDRLGGRTCTQRIAGIDADAGGTYFHWMQAAIWREVMRYELPVLDSSLALAGEYLIGDGQELTPMPILELDERLRRASTAFWADPEFALAIPRPSELGADPRAAELDARTVEDRMRELDLDPRDELALRALLADMGDAEKVSLAWVLQRMASAAWSHEVFSTLFGSYRLGCRMSGLIDAMVRDGGFEVRLSSPATTVEHDDVGVTVVLADGSQLSARTAVVATPVDVWKTISFAPSLGEAHAAATREGVANSVSNVMMHVRGVDETMVMITPFGAEPSGFEILATYRHLDDGQLLAGYSPTGGVSVGRGREGIEAALHRVLPEAELVDFVGHDWASEPYSLGGYGTLSAGQPSRFTDVLDRPVGSLFFANAEIAPQFSGLLSGAIESGARAAYRASRLTR